MKKKENVEQVKKPSASEKVHAMLKKREEKLKGKQDKKKSDGLTEEDRVLVKKARNKKKEARRERSRETDEFDEILSKYTSKILKKLGNAKEKGGHAFEEVELSD